MSIDELIREMEAQVKRYDQVIAAHKRIWRELEGRMQGIEQALVALTRVRKSKRRKLSSTEHGWRVSVGLKQSWANYTPAQRAARRRKVSQGQRRRWKAIRAARAAGRKKRS